MRYINKSDGEQLNKLEEIVGNITSGREKLSLLDLDKLIDKIIEISYCTMTNRLAEEIKEAIYEIRILLINISNGTINITESVLQEICSEFNFIEANFIKRYKE